MSAIEIKHLKLVKTIAQTENLTRAAHKLHITQSALSRQLIDFEQRIGAKLFERTKKRMILTREGNSLLDTAKSVLSELKKAEREIFKLTMGESGSLRIGVQCMFCFNWLPRVMQSFQEAFPKIQLLVSRSQNPEEDLRKNKCDLIITALPTLPQELSVVPLFEDEIMVMMSPDHPLHTRNCLRAIDFKDIKLISLVERSRDPFLQSFLIGQGVEPLAHMQVEQLSAVVELVKYNFGVSLFPRWSVNNLLSSGALKSVRIGLRGIHATWKVVQQGSKDIPAYQTEFTRLLTDQVWVKSSSGPIISHACG